MDGQPALQKASTTTRPLLPAGTHTNLCITAPDHWHRLLSQYMTTYRNPHGHALVICWWYIWGISVVKFKRLHQWLHEMLPQNSNVTMRMPQFSVPTDVWDSQQSLKELLISWQPPPRPREIYVLFLMSTASAGKKATRPPGPTSRNSGRPVDTRRHQTTFHAFVLDSLILQKWWEASKHLWNRIRVS